jgi:hypothetical protein
MKRVLLTGFGLIFLFLLPKLGMNQGFSRRNDQELIKTISGALLYLEDRQLRLRKRDLGKTTSSVETGNFYLMSGNLPTLSGRASDRKTAVWRSWVAFMPKRFQWGNHAFMLAPDDNLFLLLSTAYPLYLFSEKEDAKGYLFAIKSRVQQRIMLFKRGKAYNFWPKLPGFYGHETRTGPPFIPIRMVHRLTSFCLNPLHNRFCTWLTRGQDVVPKTWFQTIRSPQNTTAEDAFFNIPDDADDTSLAVALQQLWRNSFGSDTPVGVDQPDTLALKYLTCFRDVDRKKEDGRDGWKGSNSGAYLTWLKSEALPLFGNPDLGVIPLEVNNVDAVINANVLFVQGLTGLHDTIGMNAAIKLLKKAVMEHAWEKTSLYYPQRMALPYAISRAYRDGGIRNPSMQVIVSKILADLLDIQDHFAQAYPRQKGAFPGGDNQTLHLSTALALCTLLNIGEKVAGSEGLLNRYQNAVKTAVHFLISQRKSIRIRHKDTFGRREGLYFGFTSRRAFVWKAGLAFSSSYHDLAHWRSKAYTVAVVLEGLTKYLLEYDKHDFSLSDSPRVLILSYPFDATRSPMTFKITTRNFHEL